MTPAATGTGHGHISRGTLASCILESGNVAILTFLMPVGDSPLGSLVRAKTATGIARGTGLSIAKTYRRLRWLNRLGLVRCVAREESLRGKASNVYANNVLSVKIRYENNCIRTVVLFLDGRERTESLRRVVE